MSQERAKETYQWLISRLTASKNSAMRAFQMVRSNTPLQASLLGLPPELRLKIYDHVIDFDRDRPEVFIPYPDPDKEDWRFKYDSFWLHQEGFKTKIQRRYAAENLPQISWLCLQSTCRTIYTELRSHIQGPENKSADAAAHTYALSILGSQGRLQSVFFRSIPCPPQECRTLQARITIRGEARFWGDGGPRPIVREMYQTLNRFLHCGPKLDAPRPLPRPVKLKKMVVVIKTEDDPEIEEVSEEWVWQMHMKDRAFGDIKGFAGQLAGTGLLQGLVERMCVCADDEEGKEPRVLEEILVRDLGEEGKVPDYWKGYGFQWGFETYSKLGMGG